MLSVQNLVKRKVSTFQSVIGYPSWQDCTILPNPCLLIECYLVESLSCYMYQRLILAELGLPGLSPKICALYAIFFAWLWTQCLCLVHVYIHKQAKELKHLWQYSALLTSRLANILNYIYFILRGQAIKDLLRTIVIHPLTTAQKAAAATISPAAQLLLSGADRGMFIVGAGDEEVIITFRLHVQLSELTSMQFDCLIYPIAYIFYPHHHHLHFLSCLCRVGHFLSTLRLWPNKTYEEPKGS